jgi:hypothetical protein
MPKAAPLPSVDKSENARRLWQPAPLCAAGFVYRSICRFPWLSITRGAGEFGQRLPTVDDNISQCDKKPCALIVIQVAGYLAANNLTAPAACL